jgi:two-component system NtrC family sensor kinase
MMTPLKTPAKILVVDDEPGMREVLRLHLTDEGYQVSVVASGDAALKALSETPFDLVITDLVMRGGDGYAVMEYLDGKRLDTAVIVITGYGSTDSAVEALRRGAADYVQKPFEMTLMGLAVNRALERQFLAREAAHRAEQLSVLAEITQAINSNLDIEEVYKTLAREAGRVVDLDSMSLSLLTADGQELLQRCLICVGEASEAAPPHLPMNNSGEGWVINQRQSFLSSDVTRDDFVKTWVVPPPPMIHALIVVPLIVKDKPIGALSVGHSQPHAYSHSELMLVEQMAGQLATAIENARLLEQTQEQLETLRRTQAGLIRSARLAAVGELARGLAHELNNPLSVIIGLTQFLQLRPDVDGDLAADLQKINESASRMAVHIRNFAEFARPASEEPHLVDLNHVVEQALNLVQGRFKKQNITVETDLASPPAVVSGYAHQIRQMVLHLLFNASEAIARAEPPAAGHTIQIETFVSDRGKQTAWAHIAVSDTGDGIEPANLTRVFDPGFTTKVEEGTMRGLGMGLYLSHGLAQAHGGTINVESQVGRGSRFTIRLPIEKQRRGRQL